MEKHAICIMAHKNIEQINALLRIIDHSQIDVFLHLDSKSSIIQNNIETPRHSKLTFVKRHDVRWGDISLIEAELELFKAVVDSQQYYDRIHLISAQDLPMKSMSYILEYFGKAENKDTEFISYVENTPAKYRLKYYWFCTRHMRFGLVYKIVRHSLLLLQKIVRINRMKNFPLEFKFGSEWVSLTLSAVRYLVSEYPKYVRMFRYTTCSDELYKQMLLWGGDSNFQKKAICVT